MRIANVILPEGRRALARVETGCAADDYVIPVLFHEGAHGHDPLRYLASTETALESLTPVGVSLPLRSCTLMTPVLAPSKILAVGLNYAPHAAETSIELPETPLLFSKYPSSIIGPGEPIRYHTRDTVQVDYEAELAVVIGRTAKDVSPERALEHVLGYTVCNDVSARDIQFADGQWIRGKSLDTFCPLGPWLVTSDELGDPQTLEISAIVNNTVLQKAATSEMIFSVAQLISYFSRTITLVPGDVIATGTPAGVGYTRTPPIYLRDGDVVEIHVDRIGTLTNPVRVSGA